MIKLNMEKIKEKYGLEKIGEINKVASLNNPQNNALIFILNYGMEEEEKIKSITNSLILVNLEAKISKHIFERNTVIHVDNPRREYIEILVKCEIKKNKNYSLDKSYIAPKTKIGKETIIEPFVFIDENVTIGDKCYIKSGVKIYKNVTIGNNCVIGANTVIGDMGFGIERQNAGERKKISFEGIPLKMPHYGGVVIGNNVEIGALTTIVSGAIEPTIVEDYVKIDDHVHIAHNVKLRERVLVVAAAEISGSTEIGKNSWIGPNSSLIQKIKIGKNNIIGIGANVLKSSKDNEVLIGNPAKKLKNSNIVEFDLNKKDKR